MIAGNIIYFNTSTEHAGDLLYYLHVTAGPVFFTELPDVDNIAIQN